MAGSTFAVLLSGGPRCAGRASPAQADRRRQGLVAELDLEAVLREVLEVARELTGARYAALGILDEERQRARALHHARHRRADARADRRPPPRPRRARRADPRPAAAAPATRSARTRAPTASRPATRRCTASSACRSLIRGQAYGNLYLTEKDGGEFDAGRRGGGRRSSPSGRRSRSTTRASTASPSEAPRRAGAGGPRRSRRRPRSPARSAARPTLDRVLETIAKRARALVGAALVGDPAAATAGRYRGRRDGGRVRRSSARSAAIVTLECGDGADVRRWRASPGAGGRRPRRAARPAQLPRQAARRDRRPRPARGRPRLLRRGRAAADCRRGQRRDRGRDRAVGDRGPAAPEPDDGRARAGALGARAARSSPAGARLAPGAALLGAEGRRPERLASGGARRRSARWLATSTSCAA